MRPYNKNRNKFYDGTQVMGYGAEGKAITYFLIGGRGIGKTTWSQDYCLNQFEKKGRKFLWLRMKEPSVKALLGRDGADFFDAYILEKHGIKAVRTDGPDVYISYVDDPKKEDWLNCCRIMALSTFYSAKGVALNKQGKQKITTEEADEETIRMRVKEIANKFRNIVLDECAPERSEKKTFDIGYAFINTLNTVCRNDLDRRIILSCNLLEEGSPILTSCIGFIPNDFGIYYIKKKRCVIHMIEDSDEYKAERAKSIAGIYAPYESTFTNKIEPDLELISRVPAGKPIFKIQFDERTYFVMHDNMVITQRKIPSHWKLPVIAMQPWINKYSYDKEQAFKILDGAQKRQFKYDMLLTLKMFINQCKLIRSK